MRQFIPVGYSVLPLITDCTVVSLEPGYMDWVRDFVFLFNLFYLPSPPNC